MDEFPTIIGIDPDKCVNCHTCISACPVKFCNDGSGDHVTLDPRMCIGCGSCLTACTHGARYWVDDAQAFFRDLVAQVPLVVLMAPSMAANFPRQQLRLIGMLRQLGVEAVFDVSFGAELAMKSLAEYYHANTPKVVISQACPVIVTYIQLYHPELVPYLAPVDSPIGHCVKMIRQFYPQYADHRIAVLSPCVAKKREFAATGLGDYNIGYLSLNQYLQDNGLLLDDFPEAEFDNPPAEQAVLFSTPGGLGRGLARWAPKLNQNMRKIEGPTSVYEYLKRLPETIASGRAPLLVDCLNCAMGCNGGTLALARELPVDEVEHWIEERAKQTREWYAARTQGRSVTSRIEDVVSRFWGPALYTRTYPDLSHDNTLRIPNDEQRRAIFERMHKYSEADIYNCASCGYMACRDMATAIFNNKNRPENCHFYLASEAAYSHAILTQRETRLRSILDTTRDGFVQVDVDGVIQDANDALCEMLGREEDEVLGHDLEEFVPKDHRELLQQQVRLRRKSIRSSYEIDLLRSDGTLVNALFRGTPLFDSEGQLVGSFAFVSDITEIRDAERALRRSRDELDMRVTERTAQLARANDILANEVETRRAIEIALRDSESKLQAIVEGCPIPQFVIDRHHRVISWNKTLSEYSGIKAEEVLGTNCQWRAFYTTERPCLADIVLDGSLDSYSHWYAGKCAPSKLLDNAYEAVDFFPHMKGSGRWLYFTAALLRGSDGTVIGAVETLEDITERRYAEEERLRLEREALHSQKLESLGVLAGGIAHDFNNLLGGVLGNAELALLQLPPDSGVRESIEMVISAAQNAADLARQMLAYSGRGAFVLSRVNLSSTVRDMLHLLEVSISKRACLQLQLAEALPAVEADDTQMRQVVMNLITNASEALENRDGTIGLSTGVTLCTKVFLENARVPCRQAHDGPYVFVEVTDTGMGMDAGTIARMFDPFFTTKFTGRGLGLSSVMGIVQGHCGAVDVKSVVGQGSTVRVLFPVCDAPVPEPGVKPSERPTISGAGTVLVVDDETGIRTVAQRFLEHAGYSVLTAEDGLQGLDVFREHEQEIVCVVLDLTMPHMDGDETLRALRQIRPDMPVLLASGYSESELTTRFSERGVSGFIQKPFRMKTLIHAIRAIIANEMNLTTAAPHTD